jgi:hypothetical protein
VTIRLARSVTQPVEKLLGATNRIATGDLGVRIDHDERDELGSLMDAFNQMSSDLESDQHRIDGYVDRLKRLIQAVFSIRSTVRYDDLRPRLTRAMEELVDAEVYGNVLKADLANTCVLSLQRRGDPQPFFRIGLSSDLLESIRATGPPSAQVAQSHNGVEWPFPGAGEMAEVRDFVIAWMEHRGELSGGLIAINKMSGTWVEEDTEVLGALSLGVAEALESIHLIEGLRRRLDAGGA